MNRKRALTALCGAPLEQFLSASTKLDMVSYGQALTMIRAI